MGLDELYGINLDEYCEIHNITPEALQRKTEIDIEILSTRLKKLVREEDRLLDPVVEEIERLLDKKRKHLKRLKDWFKKTKK